HINHYEHYVATPLEALHNHAQDVAIIVDHDTPNHVVEVVLTSPEQSISLTPEQLWGVAYHMSFTKQGDCVVGAYVNMPNNFAENQKARTAEVAKKAKASVNYHVQHAESFYPSPDNDVSFHHYRDHGEQVDWSISIPPHLFNDAKAIMTVLDDLVWIHGLDDPQVTVTAQP